MRSVLFVLALALAQDDDPGTLIERLSDSDIRVRERAGRRLVELGPAARPALERVAGGSDLETAARARSILGEITLEEYRKIVLGPTGRITLPAGDYSLDQIAAAVKDQTSIPLVLPEKMGVQRVRTEADAVQAWDFLAQVCRSHGGLRVSPRPPHGAFALEAGAPFTAPSLTSGPFRVWIDRLRLERRSPGGQTWDRGSLLLALAWQPNVHPIDNLFFAPPGVHLTEIRTDGGAALAVSPELDTIYGSYHLAEQPEHGYRELLDFAFPPDGTRRLAVVRGHIDVRLPHPLQVCTFDDVAGAVGQERKAGAYRVQLNEVRSGPEPVLVVRCWKTPEPGQEDLPRDPVDLNVRMVPENIVLVDAKGKEHRGTPKGTGWSGDRRMRVFTQVLSFPGDALPASLKVGVLTGYFERRIEFEFKDVDLP